MDEKDINKEIKENNNIYQVVSNMYDKQIEALKTKYRFTKWIYGGVGLLSGILAYKIVVKLLIILT